METDPRLPILDTVDLEILMHRDVHFGGNFDVMIPYYEEDGIGVMPDFELHRIYDLKIAEEELDRDLSEAMLPEPAKAQVERAKKVYLDLRSVYEADKGEIPRLMSDLILSEEEYPEQEIHAIVHKGSTLVMPLIELLLADRFYDPLYPGYGRAPILAAQCLEKIQDDRAIPPLFQALGQDNFFTDESIIHALISFGEKAKIFLLKRLLQKPPSKDNERAAVALSSFPYDPDIGNAFLRVLNDKELAAAKTLALYAACGCSELVEEDLREQFIRLLDMGHINTEIKKEIELISLIWKKHKVS